MARIAGVDLPNEKRVEIGLTYILELVFLLQKRFWQQQELIRTQEFVI